MKHLKVTIYGLDDDAREIIDGTITLRNGCLVGDTEKAKRLLDGSPIEIGDGDCIDPVKEPERFIRSLHLYYRSAYLTVSKAA